MRTYDSRPAGAGRRPGAAARRGTTFAATLLLGIVAAGCGAGAADAPPPAGTATAPAAPDSAGAAQPAGTGNAMAVATPDSTPAPPPEPPRPETTWVRLAALGSDAPRVRRRSFRSSGDGFRVIIELRDPTTTLSVGRVTTNILSPTTSLPIKTLEAGIPPRMRVRAETTFVSTEPGEYTLYVLHDYGVRHWSVVAEAPRVQEKPR